MPGRSFSVSTGWRVTVPGGQPQLDRSTSSVGSSSTVGDRARVGDPVEQAGAGAFAQHAHRLMHGGQRGLAQAAGEDVVEADQGYLVRHGDPGPGQRLEDPDGHLVVGGDDRIRQGLAGHGDQPLAGLLPALHAEEPLVPADELALGVRAEHLVQAESPLPGVGGVRRPVYPEQPSLAVITDEVGDHRGRARPVVRRHHVGRPLVRGARYDDDGDSSG